MQSLQGQQTTTGQGAGSHSITEQYFTNNHRTGCETSQHYWTVLHQQPQHRVQDLTALLNSTSPTTTAQGAGSHSITEQYFTNNHRTGCRISQHYWTVLHQQPQHRVWDLTALLNSTSPTTTGQGAGSHSITEQYFTNNHRTGCGISQHYWSVLHQQPQDRVQDLTALLISTSPTTTGQGVGSHSITDQYFTNNHRTGCRISQHYWSVLHQQPQDRVWDLTALLISTSPTTTGQGVGSHSITDQYFTNNHRTGCGISQHYWTVLHQQPQDRVWDLTALLNSTSPTTTGQGVGSHSITEQHYSLFRWILWLTNECRKWVFIHYRI